jgi:hypothetical protein
MAQDNFYAFCAIVSKERKAAAQESLRPLCSPWLNVFSAPAHERTPAPAVHLRSSRAGG